MENQWENLERKGLSAEEIEYIKKVYIWYEDIRPGSETMKQLEWRMELERKVLKKEATPEEIIQYERLRDIEFFTDIIFGHIPKNMSDYMMHSGFADKREKDFMLKMVMEEDLTGLKLAFSEGHYKKLLQEEYEQDIEEPYIKELIQETLRREKEMKRLAFMAEKIDGAEFEYIDDETIMSIAYLILKEAKIAKETDQRVRSSIKYVDRDVLLYLVLKNLRNIPIREEQVSTNIYAENCPADAIREYIEKIVKEQKKYLEEGKQIPDELLIPQEIILSPKNIEFLINSKYVDYIGAGETGNEIQFYWKRTDRLPALELRAEKREDGKYILSYIREEATQGKEEFVWDKATEEGKKGTIVVSKMEDAVEDICDMDR